MRGVPKLVRRSLKRSPRIRDALVSTRLVARRARTLFVPRPAFDALPVEDQVRLAYNVVLRREPDAAAYASHVDAIAAGHLTARDLVDQLRASDEYIARTPIGADSLLASLHLSRCLFIRSLPCARRIIDLGGSHTHDGSGAMVLMGYPYDFDQLTIVDLPPHDRHSLYHSAQWRDTVTRRGPVTYEYRSMTDLSFAADESIDLVYSGQSIEHVTPDDALVVVKECFRVLRPGGHLAIDTPNARVCRLQSDAFIDPDHKIEYDPAGLDELLYCAGFDVVERKGLNLAAASVRTGRFDAIEVAGNSGVFAEADACYLLAFVAQRPDYQ